MTFAQEVLVVSSNLESRRSLANILNRQEIDPVCLPTVRDAIEFLGLHSVGVVFCDHHLPDGDYRDFLGALRSLKIKARVVVTSAQADWDEFLEAMKLGAFDLIATPFRPTDVEWMIIQAAREERSRAFAALSAPEPPPAIRRAVAGAD